jgi:DNA mismatch repair protein MutS
MTAVKKPKTTPMLRQYKDIKQRYPDCVLFYRMGDFYEMFYEDARIASKTLGLTLTTRGQQAGEDVPLAGFPYHSLEGYLGRMVRAGYRVAVCEQVEDPKKAKGLVKRDVTEVVTAGTNCTDSIVQDKANNFLAAIFKSSAGYGLAWADVTTGEFQAGEFSLRDVETLLASLEPAELLVPRGGTRDFASFASHSVHTKHEDWFFEVDACRRDLCEHFGVRTLKGYGLEDADLAVSCAGALLSYTRENLKSKLDQFSGIRRFDLSECLLLDPSTRRNLELVHSLSERDGPTLLKTLDRSMTPMGSRLLQAWMWTVPARADLIEARHEAVGALIEAKPSRELMRRLLQSVGDLERKVARLAAGRANARDLRALAQAFEVLPALLDELKTFDQPLLHKLLNDLNPLLDELAAINQSLVESPPLSLSQGGLMRDGFHSELDDLRGIVNHGKEWLKAFETAEREATGITGLRIKFNRVFGFHIEVSRAQLDKIPSHYQRRQTLANAERYITDELKVYEEKALGAEDRIHTLELQLFQTLCEQLQKSLRSMQQNARALAIIDVLLSFAEQAALHAYCRPTMTEDGEMVLRNARHPVVETVLPAGENFVPNDVVLSTRREQIMLLTGPNMAGKSTYLRMVGLLTLMAHMGSWLPAERATVPLCDQIFTRVGASDNLARGESTFLVEMNETAFILNNVSDKSLVLLDEIGRGTSTFDGLSLAWSITEFLHNTPDRRALTLFATHYHELVELDQSLLRMKNANIEVKQYGERIHFTRRILEGGCSHSYGIDVARMAGIPKSVLARAREVLQQLESSEFTKDHTAHLQQRPESAVKAAPAREQLTLFASPDQDFRQHLREADLESMTPLEAMSLLIQLKQSL